MADSLLFYVRELRKVTFTPNHAEKVDIEVKKRYYYLEFKIILVPERIGNGQPPSVLIFT